MTKQQNNIASVVSVALNAFESGKFGTNKVHEFLNPIFGGTLPFNAVEGVCLAFENGIKDINTHISTLSMLASFGANKSNQGTKLVAGNNSVVIGGNNTGNIYINIGAANKESASTGNSVNADSVGSGFGIVAKKGVILGAPKAKCKYLAAVAMKTIDNEVKFIAKIKNCFDGDSVETVEGVFENKGKDLNRGRAIVEVLKKTAAVDGQICFNIFGVGSTDIKDEIFKTAAEKQLCVVGISTKTTNFINGAVDKIKPMLQALYEQAAADLEETEGAKEAEPTPLPVEPIPAPTLDSSSKKEKKAKATSTAKMPKLALNDDGTLVKGGKQ